MTMGRPPKPPKDVKSADLRIRMTKAERGLLERAAKAQGEDLSTWARTALLALAKRQTQKA
jgi:uncharacterized protein (DUF1778 family)